MKIFRVSRRLCITVAFAFTLFTSLVFAQKTTASLRGQITDELGGAIVGATITITNASGVTMTAVTDAEGRYALNNLAPGVYTLRAVAPGFAVNENTGVAVSAASRQSYDISLSIALAEEAVTVAAEPPVSVEPENNADAFILRGADLDALPDDPEELAAALQALAGPSAGPNGGQIFIDGFTGGRLPPRDSIREIRINSNPFAAENDRVGFGRIEILTKPGTDKFRGQARFEFNDESLNSRNPFAPNRAPFQARTYSFNLSGPLISKRASFFVDFDRRETDDNQVINATVLDPAFNITGFSRAVVAPQRRISFGPRFDYQLNNSNTIVVRYEYERANRLNQGIGEFSLPSRAVTRSSDQHTVRFTETAILSPTIINETRLQFVRDRSRTEGDNTIPTVNVLEAFEGGGSGSGFSFNDEDRFELQNYTTLARGTHAIKTGGRLRYVRQLESAERNFGGTFTFGGGQAVQLDDNNRILLNPLTGQAQTQQITSIERYRRTLLLQEQGLSPAAIRGLGGGATQFSIASGNPEASVAQSDLGLFVQDDWRVRPNLTLSFGLRYETQTNVSSPLNFAPRFGFAWSPDAGGSGRGQQARTVIGGGIGIFYDRIAESLTLQANRFNGTNQRQLVISNPELSVPDVNNLASFSGFPSFDVLTQVPLSNQRTTEETIRRLADNLQAPYSFQYALRFERQLPLNLRAFAIISNSRTLHVLRTRNINAPLPGTFRGVRGSGIRPFPELGNIFQYESSGIIDQKRLFIGLNTQFNRRFTLSTRYGLTTVDGDTDGAGTLPANSYHLSGEYSRSNVGRHSLALFGSVSAPLGFNFTPLVTYNSGRPFNITTGRDTNGDTVFRERPAFATDLTRPSVRITPFGRFDTNPLPDQQIIPRNYGTGPSFLAVNLSMRRSFGFGRDSSITIARATAASNSGIASTDGAAAATAANSRTRRRGGDTAATAAAGGERQGGGSRRSAGKDSGGGGRVGGGGGRGGSSRGFGGGGSGSRENRYNLTFSVEVQNLLNSTNAGTPIGNLSSPRFGIPTSSAGRFGGFGGGGGDPSAGNRRIELGLRFSF